MATGQSRGTGPPPGPGPGPGNRLSPAPPPPPPPPTRLCFDEAQASLGRRGAPQPVRDAVSAFAERYVLRDRCPADDRLDEARAAGLRPDQHLDPDMSLESQP